MRFLWKKNSASPSSNGREHSVISASYAVKAVAISETGPTRSSNEDSIFYTYPDGHLRNFFGMVADGMGGHEAGEIASKIACETAQQYIQLNSAETNTVKILEGCIHSAQSAIVQAAEENSSYNGMGTTATLAYVRDGNLFFAHIGDSRLYHFRNSKLAQLTTDNTLVNEMVKEGKISESEALDHEMKHLLTQALGSVREIDPQLSKEGIKVQVGDVYFLCSDGIYDVIQPSEIESMLRMNSPELAIEIISALCTKRKASDNFSAILIEITTDEQLRIPVTKELNVMI